MSCALNYANSCKISLNIKYYNHITIYCRLQITLALQYVYVVFLACIFVELFLNKECTYLQLLA